MLFGALLYSAIVLVWCNLAYRRWDSVIVQCSGAVLGVFMLLLIFAVPILLLNALLLAVVAAICSADRAPAAAYFKLSIAVTAVMYVVVGWISLRQAGWDEELQSRYPLVSLADRLAYEAFGSRPSEHRLDETSVADLERQAEAETDMAGVRARMLTKLHQTTVQRFIDSPGFGMYRNIGNLPPSTEWIDRFGGGDYLQDPPAEDEPAARRGDDPLSPAYEPVRADVPLLSALGKGHGATVLDFVNARGFGYVRDREHVAGFQPHGLHTRPNFKGAGPPDPAYEVTHLELVSVLKFGEPRVYVLPGSFPRMDRLGDGATRSLDAFEDRALAAVQGGKDLVAESTGERLRLVGSIRAGKQCLSCHSVQRGELLGAFTYHLRKVAVP
jgi:hypothetical protein